MIAFWGDVSSLLSKSLGSFQWAHVLACVLNFCIGYYASWLQIGNQNLGKLTGGVYPCGYHHHLISNTVSMESQELPRNILTPKLLRVSIHFLKLKSKAHRTTSAVQFVQCFGRSGSKIWTYVTENKCLCKFLNKFSSCLVNFCIVRGHQNQNKHWDPNNQAKPPWESAGEITNRGENSWSITDHTGLTTALLAPCSSYRLS